MSRARSSWAGTSAATAGRSRNAGVNAGETWLIQRPGQYTEGQAELQRPEGAVHLASSDIANLWAGFFDGAIESGTRVAREVAEALGAKADRLTAE